MKIAYSRTILRSTFQQSSNRRISIICHLNRSLSEFHIERETAYPAEYDVIYLGYPIWWDDMPMPVYTWLKAHDFEGKIIVPFCTHAGSGLSGTEESVRDVCTDTNVLGGLEISGSTAQNDNDLARANVQKWLYSLDLK